MGNERAGAVAGAANVKPEVTGVVGAADTLGCSAVEGVAKENAAVVGTVGAVMPLGAD